VISEKNKTTKISLINDRDISISVGKSRRVKIWEPKNIKWSTLVERLSKPRRTRETLVEYFSKTKAEQGNLKDVGGFVGGLLKDNRRKAGHILGRDLITLDLDNVPAGETVEVIQKVETLNCSYVIYSTRSHQPESPRLRVVIPTDRTLAADEYQPVARKIADLIGMEYVDSSTFEAERLMYYPSCSKDSEFIFEIADKPFLKADGILNQYKDWTDHASWPLSESEAKNTKNLVGSQIKKQGDPTEKPGIIGLFCRTYDILEAIKEFIPNSYISSNIPDRLTYADGSTHNGAVLYEDNKFLFSHHSTDPCSGRLVNAFDLVRLHLFGEEDEKAKSGTPVNRLPSFLKMAEMVKGNSKLRKQEIEEDFGQVERFEDVNTDWLEELEPGKNGKSFAATPKNIMLILENDPALKDKFARNIFSNEDMLLDSVPWRNIEKPQPLTDGDDAGLWNFLFNEYGIRDSKVIDNAFSEFMISKEFHPVRDYLNSLEWDGVPRVEYLLQDYLGAEDTELTREMTKRTLVGAVARVFEPGCKFDYVLTIIGEQGIGKSSLLSLLAGEWFSDTLDGVSGKDAYEQLQGNWLIELGELSAFKKAEMEAIKRFVSARVDNYRPAYARKAQKFPRQSIFIATTNDREPFKDKTGNRRFWTVVTGVNPIDHSKRNSFPRDQIWAEAVYFYRQGTKLMLPQHLEQQANEMQQEFTEESPLAGLVREKLEQPWPVRKNDAEADFLEDKPEYKLKDRVCAREIWVEMLGYEEEKFTSGRAREINAILRNTPGWELYPHTVNGRTMHKGYGKQTVYVRTDR
jgi:predicted P-loop ATPase